MKTMKYSKQVYKDFLESKLLKKITIDNKEYTFRIEKGDDHKYMVSCLETGYCIEDNNYKEIKYLQNNPQEWEWCGDNFL